MSNENIDRQRLAILETRVAELERIVALHEKVKAAPRIDQLEEILYLRNIHTAKDLVYLRLGELIRTFIKIFGGINYEDRDFQNCLSGLKKIYARNHRAIFSSSSGGTVYLVITQALLASSHSGISRVCMELATAGLPNGTIPVFEWTSSLISYNPNNDRYEKIVVSQGDIVFFPDASWTSKDLNRCISRIHRKGGKVGFLLHDIIPVRFPHFCAPAHNIIFTKWLTDIVLNAYCVVCVTEYVANDIKKYMDEIELDLARRPTISWSHSGGNIDAHSAANEFAQSSRISDIFGSVPVYISVGAVEPKKNYSLILDAVELAWSLGADFSYVIVGAYGWGQAAVKNRILEHKEYGLRLFWLQNLSDDELTYIYVNSHYLIQGSLAEGFGLPIIEAASRNLPCICSDLPVLREISQGKGIYFPPTDSKRLANIIGATCRNSKQECKIEILSWEESARNLHKILVEINDDLIKSIDHGNSLAI